MAGKKRGGRAGTRKPAGTAPRRPSVGEILERIGTPPIPEGEPPVSPAVVAQTINTILDEKARFIPESGFNLVGADRFDPPGECLYLISHHETREDAERTLAVYSRGMDSVFIYGPDDL